MKIKINFPWNIILASGGIAAIFWSSITYSYLKDVSWNEDEYHTIESKTYLAECNDINYLHEYVGDGIKDDEWPRHWLVTEPDGEGQINVWPLGLLSYEAAPLPNFMASRRIWRAVDQEKLKGEFSLGREQYKVVFSDSAFKCEVMVSDVNNDGKSDIVVRKRFIKGENHIEESICAYNVEGDNVIFLDYDGKNRWYHFLGVAKQLWREAAQ